MCADCYSEQHQGHTKVFIEELFDESKAKIVKAIKDYDDRKDTLEKETFGEIDRRIDALKKR